MRSFCREAGAQEDIENKDLHEKKNKVWPNVQEL